jgi:hypothetical protein
VSGWATERRLDFIEDMLVRRRRLNRSDITRYFGVTLMIASGDIRRYLELNPLVRYDKSAKIYEPDRGFMPVRHSSADRRNAWAVWDPDRPLDHDRCDCDACRGADRRESWGETWQRRLFEGPRA